MADHVKVDPIDLHMSSDHMEMHHAELLGAHTAANGVIEEAQAGLPPTKDTGNCEAPYEQTDGKRYFLPNRVAENVGISEQQWADLLQVAKDAAAKLGATDVQVTQDQPRNHDVWFTGPAGVFIKFSSKGNMVVSGYTGCRLPQDKK